MKRFFIGFVNPEGYCDHFVLNAKDESDARKQFWDTFAGKKCRLLCAVEIKGV